MTSSSPVTWREIEERATRILGDREKARRWLGKPKNRFGGISVKDCFELGNEAQVLELLLQVEHGFVF
ncbi:hypothetical protein D3C84_654390 [compost metagenome]